LKIPNENIVGVILVVAIVLLIRGFNLLKGNDVFSSNTTLYAVYENVGGLDVSDPVSVNGLKVGNVAQLSVMDAHAGHILVRLNIKSDINIPTNSVAEIENSDLLGSKAVILNFGNANTNLQDGDTISSSISTPITDKLAAKLDPISDKVQSTLSTLDSVLTDFHSILDSKTQEGLRNGIMSLSETMKNVSSTSAKLDRLAKSFNVFMENLNEQNENINQILNNTKEASASIADADLAGTIKELNTAVGNLNGLLLKVNEGEGSLGSLLNDDDLYDNLESATYNLNLLMEDLRLNPKRYVHFSIFGRKNKSTPLPSDTTLK